MQNDVIVSPTNLVPKVSFASKPIYLLLIEDGKTKKRFISIDKPDIHESHVHVKGVYSDLSEDDINKDFQKILSETSKESIIQIMFPWHRIFSIKNLIFRQS